jgi:hypothetical protein
MRLQYTYTSSRSWLRDQIFAVLFSIAMGALLFTLALHQAVLLGGTSYLVFGAGVAFGSAPFLYKWASARRNEYGTMIVHDKTAMESAQKRLSETRWIFAPIAIIVAGLVGLMPSSVRVGFESIFGGAGISIGIMLCYQLLRHRSDIEQLARETGRLVDIEAKKPAATKTE